MSRRLKRYSYNFKHRTITETGLFSLTPFSVIHVNPGETLTGHVGQFIRMLPLKTPIFNRFFLHHWWFYVPYNAIIDGWNDYAAGMIFGNETTTPLPDQVKWVDKAEKTKYKGLNWLFQNGDTGNSGFTLRAYNLIWNKYFRDPLLDSSGAQVQAEVELTEDWSDSKFRRGYCNFLKDYESTLMPKSLMDTRVNIYDTNLDITTVPGTQGTMNLVGGQPIGNVNIPYNEDAGIAKFLGIGKIQSSVDQNLSHTNQGTNFLSSDDEQDLQVAMNEIAAQAVSDEDFEFMVGRLRAKYTGSVSFTEKQFREAFQRAKLLIKRAYYGERTYYDAMKSIGGNIRREKVLEPEMLMHSHRLLPVSDTIATDGVNTGRIGGYMLGTKRDRFPRRIFKEHGVVIGLMCIRPEIYYAGICDEVEHLAEQDAQDFSEHFYFGHTQRETKKRSGFKFDPNTGNRTGLPIADGYGFVMDNIRRGVHKTNFDVYVANRKSGTKLTGSWNAFMLSQFDCQSAKKLKDPNQLDMGQLNGIFNYSPSTSDDSSAISPSTTAIGSHALVKSDIVLKKLTQVEPGKKVLFSKALG